MPIPKAQNKKTVHLPSLKNEDGTPLDIVIQKISVKHVGMDASMRLIQQSNLVQEASYRAEQGGIDAQSVASTEPYPGTPAHYEYNDPEDPRFKIDLLRQAEVCACEAGCVSPTFAEICEAYDADPRQPWLGMGRDFETLVDAINDWSGYGGGKRMTPEESERFPKE